MNETLKELLQQKSKAIEALADATKALGDLVERANVIDNEMEATSIELAAAKIDERDFTKAERKISTLDAERLKNRRDQDIQRKLIGHIQGVKSKVEQAIRIESGKLEYQRKQEIIHELKATAEKDWELALIGIARVSQLFALDAGIPLPTARERTLERLVRDLSQKGGI